MKERDSTLADIMIDAWSGDPDAARKLCQQFRPEIVRAARRISPHDPELPQDLCNRLLLALRTTFVGDDADMHMNR